MATHVVCPLCGKSSMVRSFPSGSGTDVMLQTFRGLGRGKGFAVVEQSSGLDNRDLCLAIKPKLMSLLGVLATHGYIGVDELVVGVDLRNPAFGESDIARELEALRRGKRALVSELELEKLEKALDRQQLEMEIESLREQRESARRVLRRIAGDSRTPK